MQSMGTPKWKVFFAFFLEQALLSLAGILAVWLVFGLAAGFSGAQGVCMVICAGCYLAGCALSVAILNRSKVLKLLQEKE